MSPRLVRALRDAPAAVAVEAILHVRSIASALFIDRVFLTSIFLALASPYLVFYGAYGRIRPFVRTDEGAVVLGRGSGPAGVYLGIVMAALRRVARPRPREPRPPT